ncbi:unnamed protein product [Paramecium sonneborni]|uniref:Uncharacterized protein n=1 Tax=Paramecium sonneborni TaxID=65129 RepID=A0A8S1M6J9_9CILI|nr:unnamed protein product [Paramecium sonneborni]
MEFNDKDQLDEIESHERFMENLIKEKQLRTQIEERRSQNQESRLLKRLKNFQLRENKIKIKFMFMFKILKDKYYFKDEQHSQMYFMEKIKINHFLKKNNNFARNKD